MSAIILGSTAGILNIALVIEPISCVRVNIAQIRLGVVGFARTATIKASKQLEVGEKRLGVYRARMQIRRNTEIDSSKACASAYERSLLS